MGKKKTIKKYIVVGYPSWCKKAFEKVSQDEGKWYYISKREDLTIKRIKRINPRYVFFIHWSWLIPNSITKNYNCVNFHMTDLPYGRGGTPLQNLILRGHKTTKLTAHAIPSHKDYVEWDSGDIYLKKPLSLKGTAQEIYERMAGKAADIILEMIKTNPIPKPQKGKVVVFKRRKPEESEIPKCKNLREFYDFIRILDAEGYPKAFIRHKGFRIEFSNAKLSRNKLVVNAEIKTNE